MAALPHHSRSAFRQSRSASRAEQIDGSRAGARFGRRPQQAGCGGEAPGLPKVGRRRRNVRSRCSSRRWYITGGAGSGKTTLAADLSAHLGITHYDVDRGESPPSTADEWIVEGAHIWGMDRFVQSADEVVWLDLPVRVTVPRILLRHVRPSLQGNNRHPGVRNLLRFAAAQPDYYRKPAREPTGPADWAALSRSATERLLRTCGDDDVTSLRTSRHVRRWRRKIGL